MSDVIILEDYKKDRDYDRIMDEIFYPDNITYVEHIDTEYTDKQMDKKTLDRILKELGVEDDR